MAFPVIPRLFDTMSSVLIAEFGPDGELRSANAGFRRLCVNSSLPNWYQFTQPRLDELANGAPNQDGLVYQGRLTVGDAEGEMRTLTGGVYSHDGHLMIVAGYDIDEFESIAELLLDLNNQLDSLQRDLVRSNRELARREQVIRELSLTDALTGVGNRRSLDEKLAAECGRAKRYGSSLALLILDIDHFKKVNDTWGHVTGDVVLKSIGCLLRRFLRQSDSAARLGGEEFVVLMPAATLADAKAVAERMCKEIAAQEVSDSPPVTASFGVASLMADESAADLLARADAALYRAKTGGRNQVVVDYGRAHDLAIEQEETS
jgi:diguanylate cyclase (GGDEF)-like protein